MNVLSLLFALADRGVVLRRSAVGLALARGQADLDAAERAALSARKAEVIALFDTLGIADSRQIAPASSQQRQLWALHRLDPSDTRYHEAVAFRCRGALDRMRLEQAFARLVDRHEVLRTIYREHDDELVQIVLLAEPPAIDWLSAPSHWPDNAPMPSVLDAQVREFVAAPFPLDRRPPLRIALFALGNDDHLLCINTHHIASDGSSLNVLLRELAELYADPQAALPPLSIQYGDYAGHERRYLAGAEAQADLAFWRERLADAPPVHGLPLDRARAPGGGHPSGRFDAYLPAALSGDVRTLARRERASPFMLLRSVFALLLARLGGERDVVMGTAVANRERAELAQVFGHFVNTLVLRSDIDATRSLRDLLADTRSRDLAAFEHQRLAFQRVVEAVNPVRSPNCQPLYQVMFALHNDPAVPLLLAGLRVDEAELLPLQSKFELALIITPEADGLRLRWEYSRALFEPATIERFARCYEVLLTAGLHDPDVPMATLPLMGEADRQAVLQAQEPAPAPLELPLAHVAVRAQAERAGERIAVRAGAVSISYHELVRRVDALAQVLRRRGARRERLIAVCLPRGIDQVVAMLAVWQSGAGYLPLDPAHPPARRAAILADAEPVLVLDAAELSCAKGDVEAMVLPFDEAMALAAYADDGAARNDAASMPQASDLAYVIYTSGSTGVPKGVAVEHRQLAVKLAEAAEELAIGPGDVFPNLASAAFDISLLELLLPLVRGGTTVCVDAQQVQQLDALYAATHDATVFHAVPSLMAAWLEYLHTLGAPAACCPKLRCLLVGGDAVPPSLLADLAAAFPTADVVELYGPTEATIISTCFRYPGRAKAPDSHCIGRRLRHATTHVLGPHGELLPDNVAGELHLGGEAIARGYHRSPELTAEKFIHDPFRAQPGARLYRTGDLVRRLPDGNLLFLGRNDHQVKLRGFRIELGEIEHALCRLRGVAAAAVVLRDDAGNSNTLVAYCTCRPDQTPPSDLELRAALGAALPSYMVPGFFMFVPALPVNANGKVDRARLPAPDIARTARRAPTTAVEQALHAQWCGLLGLDECGIDDNFFSLGGHSLLAARLATRIAKALGVPVPTKIVFEAQTIAAQAECIAQLSDDGSHALPVAPRAETYPLSPVQKRIWLAEQMQPGSAVYHVPAAYRLSGHVETARFEAAVRAVCARHEALRTGYREVDGEPRQFVRDELPDFYSMRRWPLPPQAPLPEALETHVREYAERPFDLGTGQVLRVELIELSDRDRLLLVSLHHIAADGLSLVQLLSEIGAAYRGDTLPAPAMRYVDHAHATNAPAQEQRNREAVLARAARLGGLPTVHNLPLDRPRPRTQSARGGLFLQTVPAATWGALQDLARAHGTTPFVVLHAALCALLHRHGAGTDIVVGTPVANRDAPGTADLVGCLVNTAVLRATVAGQTPFAELLAQCRQDVRDALVHAALPFDALVEYLAPARSTAHHPLFQIMLAWQPDDAPTALAPGLDLVALPPGYRTAKFDLTLYASAAEHELRLTWEYASDLFEARTIGAISERLHTLLDAVIAAPNTAIARLPLLGIGEQAELERWNRTGTPFPDASCIHELIEAQVRRTPDAPALRYRDTTLSYADLNARANRLAHHLRERGVGPDVLVGLCMERGIEMVVAILGVVKAGGAYVPLSPENPQARLRGMIDDAGIRHVLCQARWSDRLPDAGWQLALDTPECATLLAGESPQDIAVDRTGLQPGHLAYVIYTSGSTGTPKGVMVPHRGLVNRIDWMQRTYPLDERDAVLQKTPYGFDVSVWEFFWPLMTGARLVVAEPDGHRDPAYLCTLIARESVTTLHFVPSMLGVLIEQEAAVFARCASVRQVFSSGEALPGNLVERFFATGTQAALHNLYGPTEASIDVSAWTCTPDDARASVPIGRPIQNIALHVLDEHLGLAPIGVPGELAIAGVGLARGYVNRPDLTAERFVELPLPNGRNERVYRTGDLARWTHKGVLEYLGRLDHQVKIRGLRIELGEIEAALKSHADVRDAVVVADRLLGVEMQLIAYVVVAPDGLDDGALQSHLGRVLPEYMVPGHYVQLPELPLSSNGKIDRKRLPAPEAARAGAGVPPQTPTEHALATIWAQVLGQAGIGSKDNFFRLGGHSLLAMRVLSAIRRRWSIALGIRAVFEHQELAALARAIDAARPAADELIVRVTPDDDASYPVSHAQQRLWLQEQLEPGTTRNVMAGALELHGALDDDALEAAFDGLVARHDILRTRYHARHGEPRQRILPNARIAMPRHDLRPLPADAQRTALEEIERDVAAGFDLEHESPLRVQLVRLADDRHRLLLALHHIASDGWSNGILRNDLSALYVAARCGGDAGLPSLPLRYVDYAQWQRTPASTACLAEHVAFWRSALADAPRLHGLPLDHPRPATIDPAGAVVEQILSRPMLDALRAMAAAHDVTLFMLLHASFALLVGRYSGASDVVLGTTQANRGAPDVEGVVGLFMNPVALRVDLSGAPTFSELLARARGHALEAFEHQAAPFDLVLNALGVERTLAHAPLVQLMLILQNNEAGEWTLPGLDVREEMVGGASARLDLIVDAVEQADGLALRWEFSTALFERSSIERLAANFRCLLDSAVAAPATPVHALPMLSAADAALLDAWSPPPLAIADDDLLVHERFEREAERAPHAVAVVDGERRLTYAELDRRGTALARHLLAAGAGRGQRVAVLMARSPESVLAFLAVQKAGAVYVPIEPDQPDARVERILAQAAPACVLVDHEQDGRCADLPCIVVRADAAYAGDAPVAAMTRDDNAQSLSSLAYTIFTSGSTGEPKGVEVEQRAILASYLAWERLYELRAATRRHLQMAGIGFDVCIGDLVRALASGGTLVICPKQTLLDAPALTRLIQAHGIQCAEFVPIALRHLVAHLEASGERLESLRYLIAGSDLWHAADLERTRRVAGARTCVVNSYGLTEAAVDSTCYMAPPGHALRAHGVAPIGRPLHHASAYVLDAARQRCPVGVVGELHVGGPGLARGYLGQPALTAERFVASPFSAGRLYRSGDLARWRDDGNLEVIGRIDHQVKIRGFRVELGEIEARLKAHPAVQDAVVIDVLRGEENRQLAAYVALRAGTAADAESLRAHLQASLPDYMVPAVVQMLAALPTNANGKIDRKALRAPSFDGQRDRIEPANAIETALCAYWCELLRLDAVSTDANFFQLGGHSLLAARLAAWIAGRFDVRIGLRQVFTHPTIQALARQIAQAAPAVEQAIPRIDRSGDLPLSSAQRQLWLIDQLEPGTGQYNIALALRLSGALSVRALAEALSEVVRRHEILRTTYHQRDGQAWQRVQDPRPFELPCIDLSGLPADERESALQARASQEASRPFDLGRDPMLRGLVLTLSEHEHVAVFTLHHIAADGWSMGVLTADLSRAYQAALLGAAAQSLPPLALQYGDYAAWTGASSATAATLDYWRQALAGAPQVHLLPLDRPRPSERSHRGANLARHLDAERTGRLRQFVKAHGVTLFNVLHAALATVLARSSLADDVVIGTPVANRQREQLTPLVGFFANTIVLRTRFEDEPTFVDLLKDSQQQLLTAIDTHPLAFEHLVETLGVERSLRHHPLFQVLLVLQNNAMDAARLDGLTVEVFRPRASVAKFDLTVDVFEQATTLELNFEYAADLFDAASIDALADRLLTLLDAAVADPMQAVGRLDWLGAREREALHALARPTSAAPCLPLVHQLAEAAPASAPAVRDGDTCLDYGELNLLANRLAHRLIAAGACPDAVVAILLPRSIELIVAVLAVLKAGAAYVGIDPDDPQERREHMLRDAGVRIVLGADESPGNNEASSPQAIAVDLQALAASDEDATAPVVPGLGADNLAYLIYTSGTTGGPKAVLQRHRTLANLVDAQCRLPGGPPVLESALPTVQYAALAFDVAIQEMATAWRTGSELVVIDKTDRMDQERLFDLLATHRIGRLFLPPAMLPVLAERALASARRLDLVEVIVAGDVLRVDAAIAAWQARDGFTLINHYGPSETHVVTHHRVQPRDGALPPIGRLLDGHGLFIGDRLGQVQPIGVPGELLVRGQGVARGYLARPELTAARFDGDQYRTGDLVRLRHNGALEFLGRIDQQVKIRGYRVELAEIDAALSAHPAVADAAVSLRVDHAGQNQLIAYVVMRADARAPSTDAWRSHLRQRLPDYMVPAAFMTIDALPLNRNGKLDRARLPEPDWSAPGAGDAPTLPRNSTEAALLSIWRALLARPTMGVHDNFFHLGGHSLLAVQLVARVQRELGKPLTLRSLLAAPTIAELAAVIDEVAAECVMVGPLLRAPDASFKPFPLTDVQQAYWLGRSGEFDLGNVGTHSYIEVPARALDVGRLEHAWNQLITRHAMLRMVLTSDGEQRVLADVPRYRIARHEGEPARAQLRARMSHQLFSGLHWPMFELAVTQLDAERSVLHVSIDALALDASSVIQLGEELIALYERPEQPLPAIEISFRDYVLSERALRDSRLMARAREYWHGRLADFPAAPDLPLAVDPSSIRQPIFSGRGFRMPAPAWQAFKQHAAQHSVTPTAAVIGVFAEVLARFARQPRFALNLTLFNRIEFHEQVNRLIGDFTSLTLLEIDHACSATFGGRLGALQQRLWADLEHKYYTGIEVQRELSRREQRAVTYPVVVTSTLGLSGEGAGNGPFSREEIFTVSQTPQVWLDFQLSELHGQLSCNWDSVEGLFREGVLDAMFERFTALLTSLAADASLWHAGALDTVPAATKALLAEVNGTAADVAGPQVHLQEPVLARMAQTPTALAVVSAARSLTYAELDRASARLATALAGVQRNELVAVVMPKHWAQVVAVLGILRAGAAYLPIDADLPPARVAQLLELGEVRRIVSLAEVADRLVLDAIRLDPTWLAADAPSVSASPAAGTDLAYVIFTSGSTGTPKGVMIDHRGALNTVLDINARYGITAADAVFGLSSLSFDLSVYDVFGVLGAGGRLVLPDAADARDPEAWLAQLNAAQVTVWNTVPALLQMLVDYLDGAGAPALPPLRTILLSGDWIPVDLPARIRRWFGDVAIYSLGGATEASIWSIDYRIGAVDPAWTSVPYGTALANQQVMALKPDLTPCPVGVAGELHLGGLGLAQGYWRDPAKTAAQFVTDPHSGTRWYRTGDLGRLLPDGNLEFLGRDDTQVKIQGYRIELGEIEARLKQHPQVKDAVVIAHAYGGVKQLLGYVVDRSDWAADAERQALIASQPGCRRDLDQAPSVALPPPSSMLRLRTSALSGAVDIAAPPTLMQLADLLAPLAAHRHGELPLPKRHYGSAGGLYPVQAYLQVGAGGIDGLVAGAYYYDPLGHGLRRIGEAGMQAREVQLQLVAEQAAIAPLYGDAAPKFSRIEAGYMATLLASHCPDDMMLAARLPAVGTDDSLEALQLRASQVPLIGFRLRRCRERAQPRRELALMARKSYRRFAAHSLDDASWQALARALARDPHGRSLHTLGWRRDGGTCWLLDPGTACWQPLSTQADPQRLFPGNADVVREAGFAVIWIGAGESADLDAGRVAQQLAHDALALDLGTCAIGQTDDAEVARVLGGQATVCVVHAMIGGAVSRAQRLAVEVSSAPARDMEAELKSLVAASLPAYMVPAHIIGLPEIPLSANGKVDRKALPKPAATRAGAEASGTQAETPVQDALCMIWREVLGLSQVGIDDSFFACGGDSIRAIVVLTRARKLGIEFSVRELYAQQTIRALCAVARFDQSRLADSGGDAHDVGGDGIPARFALIDAAQRTQLDDAALVDAYPMTWLQQGLVFHNLLDRDRGTYHNVIGTHVRLQFDRAAFHAALTAVIARHDTLRTVLRHDLDPPLQLVLAEFAPPLEVETLAMCEPEQMRAQVAAWMRREKARAFPPQRPPWQVMIHDGGNLGFHYSLACHHALLDGWSVAQFNMQLFAAYREVLEGRTPDTHPALPFNVFVAEERLAAQSQEARTFWQQQLADAPLPWWTGAAGDPAGDEPHRRTWTLDRDEFDAIERVARACGVSDQAVFLALNLVLVSLLTGRTEAVTSVVSHGRPALEGAEAALGLFLNTLPIRVQTRDLTWAALLARCEQQQIAMRAHQAYPLALIQDATGLDFSGSLFTYVNLHAYAQAPVEANDGDEQSVDLTNYRLAFEVGKSESARNYRLSLVADETVFDHGFVDRMQHYCRRAIAQLLSGPGLRIDRGGLIGEQERQALLTTWNRTAQPLPSVTAWHELFEAQVRRTPHATAAIAQEGRLSYADLNAKANALAHCLRARGVRAGDRVGLLLERSLDMVVAIYGTMKAGAAYVPFDPAHPDARLHDLLDDCRPRVVLTHSRWEARVPGLGLALDTFDAGAWSSADLPCAAIGVGPEHPAYVIYTSGSTGRPKGVLVPHRGLINRILWMDAAYALTPADVVLQKTPYTFDVSVWEFTWPFVVGACLVMAKPDGHKDPAYLAQLIAEQRVTTLHFVPSMLRLMLEQADFAALPSVRQVICSGEALTRDLVDAFFASGTTSRLHNLYGPTEASIDVSHWTCTPSQARTTVPIGHPIWNTALHVLDDTGEPTPLGVPGELHIAGVGLALGYLNRPELTAERFVPNRLDGFADARLYRTGDLVRRAEDGALEFLGRIDHQVKIRGLRIELGEIEAGLRRCDGVLEAVVLAPGQERLVAYLESAVDETAYPTLIATCREHLRTHLPDYMVPAHFMVLARLPLNPSGKIDRKALPAPTPASGNGEPGAMPRTRTEILLAEIWQRLLALERVGADDSFFDIGGDSLSLMRLAAEIRRRFGRELPVMQLYRATTLRAQGELIDGGVLAPLPLLQALAPIRDGTGLTVVAVPYAAGDGLIYHELAATVDPRIAMYAVNNPRDFDTGRDLDAQMEAFVGALTIEIGEQIDTPLVIWGHCVGYALALTLARRLLAQGADVRAVCVGGVVLDADHVAQSAHIGKLAILPDTQGIVELLTQAGLAAAHALGPEDWQAIVEKFRQDSVLSVWCNHEHFCASGAAQLPIPLICFVAADDPLTQDAEAAARHWSPASTGVRTVTLAEGGHYFVKTRSREVAEHLARLLVAQRDAVCDLEAIA